MIKWVVTCEHAGNDIPAALRPLFLNAAPVLRSHRGVDIGAKELFDLLSVRADFARSNSVSRLVIDLNRSESNPRIFSEFTRKLHREKKKKILDEIYRPYRNAVESEIAKFLGRGHSVFHISVHTFTPVLNGVRRMADASFLYDPNSVREREICVCWKSILRSLMPGRSVRMNYPYRGTSDGFTRFLRRRFPRGYAGIELEVNQKYFCGRGRPDVSGRVLESVDRLRKEL